MVFVQTVFASGVKPEQSLQTVVSINKLYIISTFKLEYNRLQENHKPQTVCENRLQEFLGRETHMQNRLREFLGREQHPQNRLLENLVEEQHLQNRLREFLGPGP